MPDCFDILGAMKPLAEVSEECLIPIETSKDEIQMIVGEDDHNWESA